MSEEILINGKKITELSDMFFEYCELKKETERLQEENKRLQMLSCANCGEKYLSPDGAELYEKNVQLQEENEELKEKIKSEKYIKENALQEATKYSMKCGEFRQALEEIRKEYTNSIFYQCDKTEEECPCHNCIILGQLDRVQSIIKKINEVLNDRD